MKLARPRWITPLIVVSYLLASNLALASQSRFWTTVAVALFALLLVHGVSYPGWRWPQTVLATGGILLVIGVANDVLPPVPLMLPPVVVPAALAWLFGHTLLRGRVALVERFARAVHAPEPLDTAHALYARGVTVMWSLVLALMALGNLFLVMCLDPGGLLQQFGFEPIWPVDIRTFLLLSNGVYVLVPAILIAEFAFRLHRFPDYRLRNPLEFARRARERLPAVVEEVRRG
jgi:uncharacterized membrane protein